MDSIKNLNRPAEILLVEDNPGDALLTQRAFRDATLPVQVRVAKTAEIAMAMLQRQGEYSNLDLPDLVLMDLNLPQMGGHDLLTHIKTMPTLQHIPVIMLSSSRADQDVLRSYSLHANAYMLKPVEIEQYQEMVRVITDFFFTVAILPCRQA